MATKREKDLIAKMQSLGTWHEEYTPTVKICADLMTQYEKLNRLYKSKVMETVPMLDKKPPVVTTLESLRRDILAYQKELGLTPSALRKMDKAAGAKKKGNKLAEAMKALKSG